MTIRPATNQPPPEAWDRGFNIAAAARAGRDLIREEPDEHGASDDDAVFFNGYFRIGYAL